MSENTKNSPAQMEYEKALSYILGLIKEGKLKIGSRLPTERAISEKLDIGRNSTREAISILHGLGMVERRQGSGNYIKHGVHDAIGRMLSMMLILGTVTNRDICEFRRNIEKSIGGILFSQGGMKKEMCQEFETVLSGMEMRKGTEMIEFDSRFHRMLFDATENPLYITLIDAVSPVYNEWVAETLRKLDDSERHELVRYHRNIYDALCEADQDKFNANIDMHYDLVERFMGQIDAT